MMDDNQEGVQECKDHKIRFPELQHYSSVFEVISLSRNQKNSGLYHYGLRMTRQWLEQK